MGCYRFFRMQGLHCFQGSPVRVTLDNGIGNELRILQAGGRNHSKRPKSLGILGTI